MDKIVLKAEKRELLGRKVKKLRDAGKLPANVYGRGVKSVSLQIDGKEFTKVFEKAGETNLIELTVGNEVKPVLLHNIQHHPVSEAMLHVDFLQVDIKKKVSAEVPVELIGISPAEKQGLGTVVQYINEIEVEALPTEIPDKFEVDISVLAEVDQMVHIKDLKFDTSKVTIESDPESIVVKVEPPKEEKEEPVAAPAEGEVTAEGEVAKEGSDEVVTEGNKEAPKE